MSKFLHFTMWQQAATVLLAVCLTWVLFLALKKFVQYIRKIESMRITDEEALAIDEAHEKAALEKARLKQLAKDKYQLG